MAGADARRRAPALRHSTTLRRSAFTCPRCTLDSTRLRCEAAVGRVARRFAGTAWQREVSEFGFVRNTYRVLLTRARYETVIYVPRGDAEDQTRNPTTFEAIAAFLLACGAEAPRDEWGERPQTSPALV